MKYVAVVVIIIMFVRIDVLLGLFDKASNGFAPDAPEVENFDVTKGSRVIPVSEDRNLKQTPRESFLSLIETFRANPDSSIRERAMGLFKDHPTMFNEKLDKTLESLVFRWREHLNNHEPETVKFLLDLMNILKGENLEMIRRFWALWMDINMKNFIQAYSKTRDSNCSIATTFGDPIPDEAKLNTLLDRQKDLNDLLRDEKLSPGERQLATNCLLVLGLEISKIAPDVPAQAVEESDTDPEEGSTP